MSATTLAYVSVIRLFAATLAIWTLMSVPRVSLAASAEGQRLLQQLVEAARKEGHLDFMVTSSTGEKGARDLVSAFKRRFGLDIQMNPDLSGQESQKFNRAVAESKSGIPPTFDLMQGEAANILSLMDAKGADKIDGWETLLAEIAPESHKIRDKISPQILAGHGFLWSTRTVALIYNPKLISEKDIPKTWKQMGDPKYKGSFSMPPWISALLMGTLKYGRDEWLEIVRALGRNKGQVLTYDAGAQRVLLGDLKFIYGNADIYFEQKSKDPNAPIGETFFQDLTSMRQVLYVVRKGAKHPNAAKLFALWATSAEANDIFEKHGYIENVVLGRGPVSQKIIKALKDKNIQVISWFDSAENVAKFRWFESPEGKEYARAIARAQKEGR
ncbi:MAG: ABC transporter substrate-binding protein [Deltaproteobacteria bacterium]|nr:ABC transporter substrate-binding protein [Deltaproteobacteria bacterium]